MKFIAKIYIDDGALMNAYSEEQDNLWGVMRIIRDHIVGSEYETRIHHIEILWISDTTFSSKEIVLFNDQYDKLNDLVDTYFKQ